VRRGDEGGAYCKIEGPAAKAALFFRATFSRGLKPALPRINAGAPTVHHGAALRLRRTSHECGTPAVHRLRRELLSEADLPFAMARVIGSWPRKAFLFGSMRINEAG
jgi:hypothetical protein